MVLWLLFALITAAVIAALGWPYWRGREVADGLPPPDQAVYRDQLAELERDAARGLIGRAEADAARNEISRRLLAAAAVPAAQPGRTNRLAFAVAALALPAIALPLYLKFGTPQLPDVPRAERLANAEKNGDVDGMVAMIEQSLKEHPENAEGWQVLATIYEKMKRFGDAASAYAKLIELKGPELELLTSFGEMDTFANGGAVTAIAAKAFETALQKHPKDPKARFFAALRLKQTGKLPEARQSFAALLTDTPPDAIWRKVVETQVAELTGPTPEDVTAAQGLDDAGRKEMIRGMVEGLEARLSADGGSLDEWMKLIRSRMVLGEPDKAKSALAGALARFKDKPDEMAALTGLARELGVE